MKTLFRSLAIVAGLALVPLAMPGTANAGYYGSYSNYNNYSGCQQYAPRYSSYYKHHRPRHSVQVVIVIKKHHRHHYPTYMAGPAYRYSYGGY
jgi:hypothetical protein